MPKVFTRHVVRELADLAASGTNAAVYVGDLDSAAFAIYGTWAGSVVPQESPDGTNWYDLSTIDANAYVEISPEAKYVRVNFNTRTSGTVECNVGGNQRDPLATRLVSRSEAASAAGGLVIHVADIDDAKMWTNFSGAGVGSNLVTAQISPDGSYWMNLSAATSAEATYAIPDHCLQARLLVSVVPATAPVTTAFVTGRNNGKGAYLSRALGSLSAAASTTAIDVTDFRAAKAWVMAVSTLSASIVVYASPDGTNYYSVGAVSDAAGTVDLPEWAKTCKMTATAHTSGAVVGYVTENTALRSN
jgi:hypothetical protein